MSDVSIQSIIIECLDNEEDKLKQINKYVNDVIPYIEEHQILKLDLLNIRNSSNSTTRRYIKAKKTLCKMKLGYILNEFIEFLKINYNDFDTEPFKDDDEIYNLCEQCRDLFIINKFIKDKYNVKDIDYLLI
jgi:hypothetical protein